MTATATTARGWLTRARSLVAPLFPEEGDRAGGRLPWVLLGGALAAAVFALRLPVARWDSLWAEDGYTFLRTAVLEPWQTALTEPWAGYYHLFPRAAAEVAAHAGLGRAPYAFVVLSALAVGWVSVVCWRFSAGHLRSAMARLLLAAAVVLVPGGGLEAVGNVANSHFFLTFAVFWVLLGRPRSVPAVVAGAVTVVVACLSDPLAVVLLPLAVGRLLLAGPARDRWVPLAYLAATAVQVAGVLGTGRTGGEPSDVPTVVLGYDLRVVAGGALGSAPAEGLLETGGRFAVHALAVVVLGAVAVLAWRDPRLRLAVAASVVLSITYFVIPSVFTLAGGVFPPVGDVEFALAVGARYSILPVLLLYSAVLLSLDRLTAARRGRLLLLSALPVLVWTVTGYTAPPALRAQVQPWSDSVDLYRVTCGALPADTLVPLPIEPGGPTWVVVLPCSVQDRLLGADLPGDGPTVP